jgi:hypothetical protein
MLKEQQTMISPGSTPTFEARLLLSEFSHRINNEFASAIGMISIAAARAANDEAKAALAAVSDQLQNYALVHHALQIPEHTRVEALAQGLGGTIGQRFGPHGATAVLIFPAEIDTTVVEAAAPEARLSSAVP